MTTFVVDASIAIKWVVEEQGTPAALALRKNARLIAPANATRFVTADDRLIRKLQLSQNRVFHGRSCRLPTR